MNTRFTPGIFVLIVTGLAQAATTELIQSYRDVGAGPFSATQGQAAWVQTHRPPTGAIARSCTSCHGRDLRQPGRHIKTGKSIEPMAVSVNPARLTDPDKVEKWFRRNCRWTLGRECTPQEKGDFIRYMSGR